MVTHLDGRFLKSEADVRGLSLVGALVAGIRVAPFYVDIEFSLPDPVVTGAVRIESSCTIEDESGKSADLSAGPDLGRRLIGFLDAEVSTVEAKDLDLILNLSGGRRAQVHAESSGYESYSVTVGNDVAVALKPAR